MNRQVKLITTTTAFLSSLGLVIIILLVIPNVPSIVIFAQEHSIFAPLLVIFWRILAIVVPPIPGSMLSYAMLPVFGWERSFIYSLAGVLAGTSLAFWLARRAQEALVTRFVPLQIMHRWQQRLSGKTEFLVFLGIILLTSPISDFMSYVAGVSRINFGKFFAATFISQLPYIAIYYVGGEAFKANIYLGISLFLAYVIIFYFLRKTEFFKKRSW